MNPRSGHRHPPVLSVGRRMFINCPGEPRRMVALTDDAGRDVSPRLADGVEVEIIAWRPRGAAGPRYRVYSARDRLEGWLGPDELRAASHPVPIPAPAPPPVRERPYAGDGDSGHKFGRRR